MASHSQLAKKQTYAGSKRPYSSVMTSVGSSAGGSDTLALIPLKQPTSDDTDMDNVNPDELMSRAFQRLSLNLDADFVSKLRDDNIAGFLRMEAHDTVTPRYYTINIENLRNQFSLVISCYLQQKLRDLDAYSLASVDLKVAAMAPVITNACMAALYARLRTIHTQYQTYVGRFNERPTYHKDIELPLPFADAIQSFGIFFPIGIPENFVCIPVYPENVQNEGRSAQNWSSIAYESYLPIFKLCGIPVKSVDTRIKTGSAWWTLKSSYVNDHYDLRCIYPPGNYSDHAVFVASIFASRDDDGQPRQVVLNREDDIQYPVRFREAPDGYQLRAFGALCHAPNEEWSQYLFVPE